MRVLLCCTVSGGVLPPQLIRVGKTERCHHFFSGWLEYNTYSASHWSTEQTMLEFVDKILVPYVKQTRERL